MTETQLSIEERESGLFADAAKSHLFPFWTRVEEVRPNTPTPRAVPCCWPYRLVRSFLERASDVVVGRDAAERRVFILANPAMDPLHTTDAVGAGVQLLLPGEVADSHRHTASAIRFVIEGAGAYSQVDGMRMPMSPGDLVVTPSRAYHDHGNESDEPAVWLDALDLPLFHMLPANFSNPYEQPQFPAVDAPDSPLVHRWAEMKARLDSASGATATLEYNNRKDGGPILTTLRATATRIAVGAVTAPVKETASGVYQVVSGRGATECEGVHLDWEARDVFAVPAWTRYEHHNLGDEPAYLFRIDEQPALSSLGMYVVEGETTSAVG